MKIKLKVKTILAIILSMIFILIIGGPIITYQLADALNNKGSDRAEIFYDAYFSYPIKFNEDRALYEMANHITKNFYRYRIFLTMQGSATNTSPEDILKGKEALEKILRDYPESEYYLVAYSKIMDVNIANQDVDELLDWIAWGKAQDDKDLVYMSDLYKAYYLFTNRDYEGANQILDKYHEGQVDYSYYYLRGNIYAFEGNEEAAEEYFQKGTASMNEENTLFASPVPYRRGHWYRDYISGFKGDHKVRGKVTYKGRPMPFVEIYVQKEGSGFNAGYTDLIGTTDINGEFETLGLRSGRYDIGIGMNPSIVYDKVYLRENTRVLDLKEDMEFDFKLASPMEILSPQLGTLVEDNKFTVSWEQVDGADYYQIQTVNFYDPTNKTGSYRFTISDNKGNSNIKGTSHEVDINKLKKFVYSMAYDGDDLRVGPSAILGTFFPGYEYSIMVSAFDSNGNMIATSIPLINYYDEITTIKIKGQHSLGEKYIIEANYEGAIDHYKDILKSDPNNEEALIYLSKIFGFGWMDRPEYIERAVEYANRYMDIYDDGSLLLEIIGNMNKDHILEYSDLIHGTFDTIPRDERGSKYYFELGKFKSNIGEYEAARDAYELTENYIPRDAFYIDLYLGDIDKAIERLDDFRTGVYRMSKERLKNNLIEIDENVLVSDDYESFKDFLEKLISGNLNGQEKKELMSKTIASIDNNNIKEILHQIKLEEYLDWGH